MTGNKPAMEQQHLQSTAGRAETVRYHREFYRRHGLFQPGSWLAQPSPFVLRCAQAVNTDRPVRAYDLGCGVGRHTIPLARLLPPGSSVLGVDLLTEAITTLMDNATTAGVADRIHGIVADLETLQLPALSADLIVGCSALEHVSSPESFQELLLRCQQATRVGGVHALTIATDRYEQLPDGAIRPALAEMQLSSAAAEHIIMRSYQDWELLELCWRDDAVAEERHGQRYELRHRTLELGARRLRLAP